MPDGRTHRYVGITAGAGYAAYEAKERTGLNFWLEVFGGAVGGEISGRLPDVLEPAISSWHRGTAHSVAAGGAIISAKDLMASCVTFCREQADLCHEEAQRNVITMIPTATGFVPYAPSLLEIFISQSTEMIWSLLAGFLNGMAAGYVSHLALDCCVGERGIPLLTRGF
jgi:hypothetical protein